MVTNNFFRSDLQGIYHVVQSSMIVYPKEMIISVLRDFFSKDSYYHYVKDEYGFAKTTDHTDLPLNAGLYDNSSTRLFIGENYRYDGIYYPAILVKSNGSKYVPISANREAGATIYEGIIYEDGYGHSSTVYVPKYLTFAGIWEGSISIDVVTRSLRSRDDLVELIALCFADIMFETLRKAGIVVKPPSIGGPSETDDRNDKLFKQTITIDIRSEWRRNIPVKDLIDKILFETELVNLDNPEAANSPNFAIRTEVNLAENLINMG